MQFLNNFKQKTTGDLWNNNIISGRFYPLFSWQKTCMEDPVLTIDDNFHVI